VASSAEMTTRDEWRAYWPVVLAGVFGVGLTSVHVYTIGTFISPLEAEFGWTRAQISAGVGVSTMLGAIFGPVVGMLIDRFGPRRLAQPGALVFYAATAAISLATSNVWLWWFMWAAVATGGLMIKPVIWTSAVAGLFDKARGFALAVTLCGTALASALMPIVSTSLIDSFGWRTAYVAMAGILFLATFPLFWFCLDSAADRKRRSPAEATASTPVLTGLGVREALLTWRFFKLALAAFIFTFCATGIVANLVPILTWMEVGRTQAAAIAGLAGLTSVVGRLTTGYLLDRFNPNIVGGISVLFPVITCALLLTAGTSVPLMILAVVIMGLALGAELDVIAYLTARHFGTARYGTIFSIVSSLWSLAVSIGPTLANHVYDRTGGYSPVFWAYIPLFVIVSLCLMTLSTLPDFSKQPAQGEDNAQP